jgi:hypothetical protein
MRLITSATDLHVKYILKPTIAFSFAPVRTLNSYMHVNYSIRI